MNQVDDHSRDFVALTENMLRSSSQLAGGNIVSDNLVQSMADQMEIAFINSQLIPKVQRLKPIQKLPGPQKIREGEVRKRRPVKPAVIAREKFAQLSFFPEDWAASTAGRRELVILYSMIRNTSKYISKMNRLYAQFSKKELQLVNFSNDHTSLEKLTKTYFTIQPLYLCNNVREQRRVSLYSNWVALTIAHIVKRQIAEEGKSIYDGLLMYQKNLDQMSRNLVEKLAAHCSGIYTFYHALGDFVIFSPELFDRTLLLKYPQEEVDKLINNMKRGIPQKILDFKKL